MIAGFKAYKLWKILNRKIMPLIYNYEDKHRSLRIAALYWIQAHLQKEYEASGLEYNSLYKKIFSQIR